MKRQRGRGRKPGGGGGGHYTQHTNNHQPNRTLESNGPDMKVRGPAAHIYERYLQLARDASSSGDRVLGENYLQHADHYFRLLRAMQPATPVQPVGDRYGRDGDFEADEGGAFEGEGADAGASAQAPRGGEPPETEFSSGQQQPQSSERDGEFRRRRGRRTRFRPEGQAEGGEPAEAREGGQEWREPAPREGEREGPEGFAVGPKPAFLRSD